MNGNANIDYNLSATTYFAQPGCSNSMLSKLKRSPAHLKYSLDNPQPPTPQMVTGTIIHAFVLEPDNPGYVRGPEGDRRTKAVKQAYADLEEEGWSKSQILTPAAHDQAIDIRDAIYHHPIASQLLLPGNGVTTEASMFWEDRTSGVQCRGRIDALPPEDGEYSHIIADLKTTTDASAEAFSRSAYNWGYHRAASFYLQGFAEQNSEYGFPDWKLERTEFVIVAVEKTEPYAISIFQLNDDAILQGATEVDTLLSIYRTCEKSGEWPSYPQEIQELSLPGYAFTQ